MSEATPNIDYEAQSLLVFTGDTSPRRVWSRLIVLLHSISKFRSEAESGYSSIDDTNAEDDEGQSEFTVVVDGSSAQDNSLSSIEDQLDSKVASKALRSDSHHGIELPSQFNISEISITTRTASRNASTVQSVLPKSHQDQLQRSQTMKITQIMKERDLNTFNSFGGIHGVADALSTDLVKGLHDKDDICCRKKRDFQNQLPKICFITLLIDTCKSFTTILLLVAAVLSLGFGLKEEGPQTGWHDGAILFLMITLLVLFTSLCRYYHKKKLLKKIRKQGVPMKTVHVTRGKCNQPISISDLVRGDIVLLERGYEVPCDGFYIDGKSLEVDSGSQSIINDKNPFLFYGSRVITGSGRMIVASVGTNTVWGELMRTNSRDKKSKVETHLDKLMEGIHINGLLITILVFTASFLRFALKKRDDANGYRSEVKEKPTAIRYICNTIERIITEPKGTARTLTSLLSISLVGIMENMPMVVSTAITLWNDKVLSDEATCHHDLLACVKSSSVTRICTDKIGGLTEQQMEVNMVSVGCDVISDSSSLSPKVIEALCEGIGTSVLTSADSCNVMEASLCLWANDAIGLTSNNLKTNWELLRWTESDACKNPCGVLIKKTEEDDMCLHWKGPVREILAKCSRYYDKEGNLHRMNSQKKLEFEHVDTDMLKKQLKTVALACRPTFDSRLEGNDLDLIGLIGLKDSSKETTKVAIASAFSQGVKTILVSADDVSSLKPIAVEHGLLNLTSDLVLKGEDFQKLTDTERMEKIDQICILGNCLPADKQFFVKCLRDRGEVVAMVGMQTTDAPALIESDIGVALGTWNSAIARESSDITIWNEGLYFFFDVIFCGRCVYGKLQKFIQVLLIMTISSLLINFIGVVLAGDAPMTAVQFFGLNLLMTFIDGMALLGSPLARRRCYEFTVGPTGPLITMAMTRNVIAQSSYQIIILMTLQQKWHLIEGITQESIQSMIFKSLIICQVFNLFNARELQKKNFFKGINRDFWFWCALAIYILLHTLYVAIECRLAKDTSLNYRLWAGCFFIGIVSWLVDWIWKLVLPSSRIECFTGWLINSAGKCKMIVFKKDWRLAKGGCLHSESLPPETNSNLHDPLINTSESLSTPHQCETLE